MLALSAEPLCAADAECAIRRTCGCACCPELVAMTQAQIDEDKRKCSVVGPCRPAKCPDVVCASADAFKAVCEGGKCVAKPARKPQCVADTDCTISSLCACGCCSTWKAMTKAQIEAEKRKCSRMGQCGDPGCGDRACDEPNQYKAVCEKGRCVTKGLGP